MSFLTEDFDLDISSFFPDYVAPGEDRLVFSVDMDHLGINFTPPPPPSLFLPTSAEEKEIEDSSNRTYEILEKRAPALTYVLTPGKHLVKKTAFPKNNEKENAIPTNSKMLMRVSLDQKEIDESSNQAYEVLEKLTPGLTYILTPGKHLARKTALPENNEENLMPTNGNNTNCRPRISRKNIAKSNVSRELLPNSPSILWAPKPKDVELRNRTKNRDMYLFPVLPCEEVLKKSDSDGNNATIESSAKMARMSSPKLKFWESPKTSKLPGNFMPRRLRF